MIVGCPKEIKPQEGRVGLLPSGVAELVRHKHTVVIQSGAGATAGAPDAAYVAAGAQVVDSAEEVYKMADLIVKVKEPLPEEYKLVRRGQIVFTYFHFAASRQLTEAMMEAGCVCIAYETVEGEGNRLVLLEPMSEVAGRMAVQKGMHFLEAASGGKGVLLGGVPGTKHGRVLVIGGGVVGFNAAKAAAGIGADVVIFDKSLPRLRYLEPEIRLHGTGCLQFWWLGLYLKVFAEMHNLGGDSQDSLLPRNCTTRYASEDSLREELPTADLVIGAVLLPGRQTPKILRREHLSLMEAGSVIVDVSVDHGGCCETTKTTYHEAPTYTVDNILHYCVANMPGAVPVTSAAALTNATIHYVLELANLGWKNACLKTPGLLKGLSIVHGKVVHRAVADTFGLPHHALEELHVAS
ncbi:hypothetical protein Emag_006626 [Eimeria magna]